MRREGRLHGSNVRVNKKELGMGGKTSSKPTNHSKVSARCPGNAVRCQICSHGLPVNKSIGKVKTALKARDLDVTKNHKMYEWSFSQKHRWGDLGSPYGDESDEEQVKPSLESDGEADEYWDDEPARSPVMVLPIECLMQLRKKSSPKAQLQLPPCASEEDDDLVIQSAMSDCEDNSDDSWCEFDLSDGDETFDLSDAEETFDMSDEEETPADVLKAADDWVLVAESL